MTPFEGLVVCFVPPFQGVVFLLNRNPGRRVVPARPELPLCPGLVCGCPFGAKTSDWFFWVVVGAKISVFSGGPKGH